MEAATEIIKEAAEDETGRKRERSVYLLERRSMLLSGREKLDSTVQESDMLTLVCCDHRSETMAGDVANQQTPASTCHTGNVKCVSGSLSPPSLPSLLLSSASSLPL